jgi:Tol biopolymer transport system component
VANGRLRRIDPAGGSPQNISDLGGAGTWNKDGIILFAARNVLYRVPALGGDPTQVTTLNAANGEIAHFWPYFLPDGRHFVYNAWAEKESNRAIYVGSLDSKDVKRLVSAQSMAVYAGPGYMLYQRDGVLFAHAFDAKTTTLAGEPIRVADQIPFNTLNGRSSFAASQTGVVVFRANAGSTATQRFAWFDRSGKEMGTAGEPGPYGENFALSPDGKQVAVSILDASSRSDLWVMDWERGVTSRFSYDAFGAATGRDVVWSPDGLKLAFSQASKGNPDIYIKNASGIGQEELLVGSPNSEYVEDWSPDGKYIVYGTWAPTPTDLWAINMTGDRKPFPVVQSPFRKDEPHFSFDGKWLAYSSEESGRWQIYVISFPAGDQKRQISTNGGAQPRWRRDGKELYYLATDGKMMAVDINTSAGIGSGIPRTLFDTGLNVQPTLDQYAVTSDGQRFLILKPIAGASPAPITVIVNWAASLKK